MENKESSAFILKLSVDSRKYNKRLRLGFEKICKRQPFFTKMVLIEKKGYSVLGAVFTIDGYDDIKVNETVGLGLKQRVLSSFEYLQVPKKQRRK